MSLSGLVVAVLLSGQGPIAKALQPFVDHKQLPGAVVLVADDRGVIVNEAVGFADVGAKRPMRTDSLFWIASMTKTFTAAAVMILVDEGKVKLDDPVSKYLPEFSDLWVRSEISDKAVTLKRPGRAVVVRDLLMHTSGLTHITPFETGVTGARRVLPLWLGVKACTVVPLESEPGSRWAYSNSGFVAAGRLVEVVSGLPYEEFLRKRIFDPLGMRDTTFSLSRSQVGRLARSYEAGPSGLTEVPIVIAELPFQAGRRDPMPAGGLYSTAADVGRFCRLFLCGGSLGGNRVLSEASVSEMMRQQTTKEQGTSYGLGWFVNPTGSVFHNGAYGTLMCVYPKENRVIVSLMQHATIQRDGPAGIYDAIFKAAFSVPEPLNRVSFCSMVNTHSEP